MADPVNPPAASPLGTAVQVAKQAKDLWGKQPRSRRMIAAFVVLGIAIGIGWSTFGHKIETWSVAIDGLSPDDETDLFAALNARGVAARLNAGKVEVKDGDLDDARAIAASAGLPFSGKGFELFDGNNLGQSSFTEQVNYRRALQGELSRSITTLAQVESARVHLAVGKHSVFKEQDVAPSASVALHLHAGQTLTSDQVRGVRSLVASSVEGLKPEAVVILDGHGNILDSHDPTTENRANDLEHGVSDRVRQMLEKVVGVGHVSVVASAELDSRLINQTEDFYDKDHTVVRSESRTIEGNDPSRGNNGADNTSGVAGTRGNLPGSAPASSSGGPGNNGRLSESKNYEISHKTVQTTNPEQILKRLQVAILIDEPKDKDGKIVARSKEQLDQLIVLAKQAAGIDETRGDVLELRAVQFAPVEDPMAADVIPVPEPFLASLPVPLSLLVGAGVGALVLLTTMVLLVKRLRRKRAETKELQLAPRHLAFPTPVAELERVLEARPQLGVTAGAKADEIAALPPGRSIQERVTDVVRLDIERAAGVLTAWLQQPAPTSTAAKGAK
jgi:flagellar M-ring protein FliF